MPKSFSETRLHWCFHKTDINYMKKISRTTPSNRVQKIASYLLLFILASTTSNAQQITGQFSELINQRIKLVGYSDFASYVIDSTQTDGQGRFILHFSSRDKGIGLLEPENTKPFITLLADDTLELMGKSTMQPESIEIISGKQTKAFVRYITEQPKREQALSAWMYLQQMYTSEPLYTTEKQTIAAITREVMRITSDELSFLDNLEQESFLKWYIPMRKTLSSVGNVAHYRPNEIPQTRKALRTINYADNRLYNSGLLKEAIENHIWFVENSSGSLDSVFTHLNTSIDIILEQLKDDTEKFNLVAARLFEVLEERSLFTSSEYLSKQLLKNEDCGCLHPDLEKRLHKYGKMATGAIAPDIEFGAYTYYPEGETAKKLSEVKADYYLLVFAAGWCAHCKEALPKIAEMYPHLKAKNIEVVLVSLDENTQDFTQFAAPLPFISTTDFKKWESQPVIDYQVYGTPSYFMLNKDLTILKKLTSLEHIKTWVDWAGK